jgi:2-C-methyl-D-erythritol 4-phosphate cytidylyltransferase
MVFFSILLVCLGWVLAVCYDVRMNKTSEPRIIALIPAGGVGARFGVALPKQYLQLAGEAMIFHTIATLAAVPRIEMVKTIIAPADAYWQSYGFEARIAKLSVLRVGGETRAATVLNGINALFANADIDEEDWLLVHDAARPCVGVARVQAFVDVCSQEPVGGLLAGKVADTIKAADANNYITHTVPRDNLWAAQTPQMFRAGLLRQALQSTIEAGQTVTDEAQAVSYLGYAPRLFASDNSNLKVTLPADLLLAERYLNAKTQTGKLEKDEN